MNEPYRPPNHHPHPPHGYTYPVPAQHAPPNTHPANHRSRTDPSPGHTPSPPPPVPFLPPPLAQFPNPHPPAGPHVLQRPRAQSAKPTTNVLHRRRPVTAGANPNSDPRMSMIGTSATPFMLGSNMHSQHGSSPPLRPPPPPIDHAPMLLPGPSSPYSTPNPHRRSFAAPPNVSNTFQPADGRPPSIYHQSFIAPPPPPVPLRPSPPARNLVPDHPPALRASLSHSDIASATNWGTPSPTPPALPPLPPSLRAGFSESRSKPPLPPKHFTSNNDYGQGRPPQSPHETTSPIDPRLPNPRLSLPPPPIPPPPPSLSSGNLFFESGSSGGNSVASGLVATSPSPMTESSSFIDSGNATPFSTSPKPQALEIPGAAENDDLARALLLSQESYRNRELRDKEEGENVSFALAMSRERKPDHGIPSSAPTPTRNSIATMPPRVSSLVNAAAHQTSHSHPAPMQAETANTQVGASVPTNDGWEHYDPRMFEAASSSRPEMLRPVHMATSVSAPSVLTVAHSATPPASQTPAVSRHQTPRANPVELLEEPRDVDLPTYDEIGFTTSAEEPPASRSAPAVNHVPVAASPPQATARPASARVSTPNRSSQHVPFYPPPATATTPAPPSGARAPSYTAASNQAGSQNRIGRPTSVAGPTQGHGYPPIDQLNIGGPSGLSRRSQSARPAPAMVAATREPTPPLPMPNRPRAGTGSGSREDATGGVAGPSNGPLPTAGPPLAVGDLFTGVSFGFNVPTITQASGRAQSPIFPDAFALDSGSAFHIMAPTYRHLLRVLAHLSSTHVQPTPGAIAACKDPSLFLRATLQFVKVPFTEAEFRTVLWLEIDTPVPPLLPGGWKFTNGDTTHLPYSTSIPPPIKHSPPSSQLFVLQTPLPTLPISLPSLAMYLHGAFVDSKKSVDTSGVRRLSKIVVACYGVAESGEEIGEEGGTGAPKRGLLARVMGRKDRRAGGGAGNEQMYDLVTPLRLDEWG